MRISLLLAREPFGEILSATLSRYWRRTTGQADLQVTWFLHASFLNSFEKLPGQRWFCNIFLNAIFTPATLPEAWEPIRREFTRSLSPWKRPFQQAYVQLASSPHFGRFLAQASLAVLPGVADAENLLIIPGNQNIRILNCSQKTVIVLIKQGFDPAYLQKEIAVRRSVERFSLPVPRLIQTDETQGWFQEEYILGTPLNRLPDPLQAERIALAVHQRLAALYADTLEDVPTAAYIDQLLDENLQILANSPVWQPPQRTILQNLCHDLAQQAAESCQEYPQLQVCCNHGDFQPANILADGDRPWLIDWVYSARRQIGYDALVYVLRSRFPGGLADRMRDLETSRSSPWFSSLAALETRWSAQRFSRLSLTIFLLEELHLHLAENACPFFSRPGEGALHLLSEISAWMAS